MSPLPLEGVRVLDLSRVLAGPFCSLLLADFGADVVKVESPQGDDTRQWGPPFVNDAEGKPVDAAYFHSCNRGKRSVIADFSTGEGRTLVQRLVKDADVVIENFKVGTLARFGLDHPSLSAINPRLIYCSITGFGQTGPYAHRAGYDFMIQGMTGIMDLTGEPEGAPQKVGVAFADIFTGTYSAVAILAALAQRERSGQGQHIDMALMDSMVGVLANQGLNYLISGRPTHRMGNAHPNIVPYQSFAVSDGYVNVAVGIDAQFARLCEALGLMELASNPLFATNAARVAHRAQLIPQLQDAIRRFSRDDLLQALEARGVPAGPINDVEQVFADPQVRHRAMQLQLDAAWASGGGIPGIRNPLMFSKAALELARPAPRLGEHTREVLEEIGLPP